MSFTNPPLSGSDIKRRFNGKTKVLLYDKLAQYDDIDKLLAQYMDTALFYYVVSLSLGIEYV